MQASSQMYTPHSLMLRTYTWPRDSHGLFDYESQSITKDRIRIQDTIKLYRADNNIISSQSQGAFSMPALLSVEKTASGFIIKPEPEGEMWVVIDCSKARSQSKGYKLNPNEVVKLGRVRYIVKEVSGYADENIRIESPLSSSINLAKESGICRICLVEEEEDDPLIAPCNCGGSMKHIHLSCFKKWIESRTTKKQNDYSTSYYVKALTCEISRCPVQPSIVVDGQNIDLLNIQTVEPPFIKLESSSSEKNEYNLHLISLNNKNNVRLGRGHDSDIRISDISVSRCHAVIRYDSGEFYLEDNSSKFGTLVEGKEIEVSKGNSTVCLQVGRTLMVFSLSNPDSEGLDNSVDETDEEQD